MTATGGGDRDAFGTLPEPRERRRFPRGRRLASVGALWVGAAVLASTVFVGWYAVSVVSGPGSGCTNLWESLAPFSVTVNGSGNNCGPAQVADYRTASLPATGTLYSTVLALVLGAAALAGVAGWGILRGRHRDSWWNLTIGAVGTVLAAAAPVLLLLEQPAAICSDQGFSEIPFTVASGSDGCNHWSFWTSTGFSSTWWGSAGPWNSFVGGSHLGTTVFAWGPAIGWYLGIAAAALLALGVLLADRDSRPTHG
jgi:hypothetical protein